MTPSSPTTMTGRETDGTTPRPWAISEFGDDLSLVGLLEDGAVDREIAPLDDVQEADAELIVAAVNDYDRLRAIEKAAAEYLAAMDDEADRQGPSLQAVVRRSKARSALAVKLREEG